MLVHLCSCLYIMCFWCFYVYVKNEWIHPVNSGASFSSGNTLSSLQALPQADFLLGGLPPPSDSWSPFIGASFYSPLCFLVTALLPLIISLFLCVLVCGHLPGWGWELQGQGPVCPGVCIPSSAHGPLCVSGVCSLLEEGMMSK